MNDKMTLEPEEMLLDLLKEGLIIINNGHWDASWPKDRITVSVICNDVFAWGCADAEDITYSELAEVHTFWKKDPNLGVAAWCVKKRKARPQPPMEKLLEKDGIWTVNELIGSNNG